MDDSGDLDRKEALAEFGAVAGSDLTTIGRRLIDHAHQILAANDTRLRSSDRTLDGDPVRIGISSMLLSFLVDDPSRALLAHATVRSDVCSKIVQAFDDDDIDVAMVMDVRNHRATLGDDLVAEFDIDFAWMKAERFALQPGAPIPLATWPPDQHIILNALSEAKRPYKVMFTGPDYAAKLTAVRSGTCVAVVPRHAIASPLVEATDGDLPAIAPRKILLGVRCARGTDRFERVVSALSSFPLAGSAPYRQ